MFAAPVFRADACLSSLPAIFNAEHCHPWLAFPARPIRVHLSRSAPPPPSSIGLQRLRRRISVVFPVQAQQIEVRGDEPALSDWEGDGEGVLAQEVAGWDETEGEASEWDPIDEGKEDVAAAAFREPPEDAKLFVGNLPFDVDSEMLARLFQKAGVVELAEVIYNRETDQSRGFGFVVMSSVEEAEKAVEKLDRQYFEGRMLTVKKAAPRGSRAERSRSERIYVGNLPWSVDEARLEQVFGEYGQVLDSKVVCDRESGRSRGFAFVTMSAPQETENAIAALDGKNLDGRTIRVNAAEEKPRRGGAF